MPFYPSPSQCFLPGLTREPDHYEQAVFSCAKREQRAASRRRGRAHRGLQMPGRMHGPPTLPAVSSRFWPSQQTQGHIERHTCLKAMLSVPPAACGKTEFASRVSRPVGEKTAASQAAPTSVSQSLGWRCLLLPREMAALGSNCQLVGMSHCCWS